ncbi:cytoplasmic protein [Pseudarthrobacter sp. PS3-L1]|uniref:cupin domain-containing protein n=1 Tax=Pseudarthrobacter sp. PS3-L1 TaxID=3046207 RepID=UPI0024BBC2E5|nr:cytoplasmic protein [Pseudarthrobacter sp. PS3-L1]MDJ0320870.1 cytoplasmic protein [Pseudarthrobacter sp. PS3-L1]
MSGDPVQTNPGQYSVLFENDRVRVLEYRDRPGFESVEHSHPDSVMITASSFRRRLSSGGRTVDVDIPAGSAHWLPAQTHSGRNTGQTDTHSFFVELKEPSPHNPPDGEALGPQAS